MFKLITAYRSVIIDEMLKFIEGFRVEASNITSSKWYFDAIDRISIFSTSGKMIRGGLILFTEEMFKGSYSKDGVYLAIATELLQSALLIHDDIMDKDMIRRGSKTIFFQYKEIGDKEGIEDSYHFGESMGVCVGDIALDMCFSAVGYLSNVKVISRIIKKFGLELSIVGGGQMEDVYLSSSNYIPTEEEVVSMYKMKTSRYSFSLPFSLGAILSEVDDSVIELLESFGDDLGIVFQIHDDEIGLFGNQEAIGKPVGSDIKENKKTLFFIYLMRLAKEEERRRLSGIFGNEKITKEDVETVLNLIEKYKVREMVLSKKEEFANKAREKIKLLPVEEKYKKHLFELVDYNLSRNK
jgi:geranylgeranyl diphosphate synthase type I